MNTYTNPDLIEYYNLTRGTTKTELTLAEVISIGCTVKCVDVYPASGSPAGALHLTDGFVDITANGIIYTSFPDFVNDSFPSFTEQNQITNDAINFKVSNIDPSFRVLAIGGAFKNAMVNLYLSILNPADSTVIEHDLMFSGYIDYFQTVANNQDGNEKNETTCNVNSIWKKLDVQLRTLAANSVHQSTHKGDNYFSLLGITNGSQFWNYK